MFVSSKGNLVYRSMREAFSIEGISFELCKKRLIQPVLIALSVCVPRPLMQSVSPFEHVSTCELFHFQSLQRRHVGRRRSHRQHIRLHGQSLWNERRQMDQERGQFAEDAGGAVWREMGHDLCGDQGPIRHSVPAEMDESRESGADQRTMDERGKN